MIAAFGSGLLMTVGGRERAASAQGLLMTLSGRDRIVRLKSAREPKQKTRLFGSRRQSPVLS